MIPTDFCENFMKRASNKTAFNSFLQERIQNIPLNGKEVYFSHADRVTYCGSQQEWRDCDDPLLLHGCHIEEADTKIPLHVLHMISKSKLKKISVKTNDTDVVILLVSFMPEFVSYHPVIFVDFNFGKHRKIFDVVKIARNIGFNKCSALRFFFAFTGCDTTSFFFEHSKRIFLEAWLQSLPEITFSFSELSCMPQSLTDESISACQRLIMTVYDKKMKFGDCDLGDLRFFLFNSSSSNDLRRLPPTADSLKQHVLRAAYQAGWIWGSCIFKNSTLPDPKNWGWRPDGSMLVPVWKTQETANYNILFTVCSCQKKCQRCKCSKLELSCLPFCKCLQKCSET